ncbi:MAG TPA: hypothetical protein VJL83_02405 [Patescibacteria group bacterium]|nr:hypothetical protein [Patescibacteria group bacterium]
MQSIQTILKDFNPVEDKYVSREFQSYGIELSEKLGDWKRRALYIKLAKTIPRPVLEKAYSFVADSTAKNKAALFMWKLKELGAFNKNQRAKKEKRRNQRTTSASED